MKNQPDCGCPCKFDPVVMPINERVCHRTYYVEQPVIIPCQTRVVNHYVPRPTYYYTYNHGICQRHFTFARFIIINLW